jgi:hypothetical protein
MKEFKLGKKFKFAALTLSGTLSRITSSSHRHRYCLKNHCTCFCPLEPRGRHHLQAYSGGHPKFFV